LLRTRKAHNMYAMRIKDGQVKALLDSLEVSDTTKINFLFFLVSYIKY